MGLFPQFPFSNLHELNLDWIIEQIRQVTGEGVVLSVNGLSGVVTLYTENNIALPDCHYDTEWSVSRLIDEKVAGLKFTGEKFFYITKDHDAEEFTVQEVYTSGNQPPYPVTSVNGETGDVMLAGDNLPYVIDGSYTIEDIVEAIQLAIGAVIRGKKCEQAVTAGQYVFLIMSNITGRTDGLYKAVNDVPANTDFTTGDLFPATDGLGGKLGEAEDNIDDLDTRLTSVEEDTATLKDDLPTVAESVDFVIRGNVCTQAVTAGQYVTLLHSTISGRADGFYQAVNSVSASTPWTSADLQALSGGLGAVLNSKVNGINIGINGATFKGGVQVCQNYVFKDFEYVDLYLTSQGVYLPCIRIFPHHTERKHGFTYGYLNDGDNGLRFFICSFETEGNHVNSFTLYMSNTPNGTGSPGAFVDVSTNDILYVSRIIGYN